MTPLMMRTRATGPVRTSDAVRGGSGTVRGATYGEMTLAVDNRSTESLYGQSRGQ